MAYNPQPAISLADTGSIDAFCRLRVSDPVTQFGSKMIVDNLPLFWDDAQTSGSGTSSTYNTNQSSVTMAVSNLTAGTRVRQTFRRFNYQCGKSQLILLTGVAGAAASGITKRMGYYDNNNGLFFQLSGSTMSVVRRTFTSGSAVDDPISQTNWNIDKMDGSGISGHDIDLAKTQIGVIDFEWLGVGRVRMRFCIDGIIHYCHQFLNANNLSIVYMTNPNLPLRYEISNDGTGPAATLVQICSTVISEGASNLIGHIGVADRGATSLVTANNTSLYPLVAIQLRATYNMFNISLAALSVICTSTSAYRWCLLLNPTVVGTALSFSAITNSAIQADVGTTNATTLTGGTVLYSAYAQNASEGTVVAYPTDTLSLGETIGGTRDIIVLAVQRITGTTETFYGSLAWKELG